MVKYTIQRLILAFVTAFIILTATFFLVKLLPFEKPIGTTDSSIYAFYANQVRLGYLIDVPTQNDSLGECLWTFTDTENVSHNY